MTHQKIHVLNDITINQIAAGEVIENPISVIKELVENSLDAGAQEIIVETKAGGRGLIQISDDGCGMHVDDLLLSVERHATSKLENLEGLNRLNTLGFRGEALPSIASISKMRLHSTLRDGEGALLQIEGGKIGKLLPLPRRRGTTIEVRSLFFNVPVRKKFQKHLNADLGEIQKLLGKFAFSYPTLTLSWHNDGKQCLNIHPLHNLDNRMELLLGENFVENSFPVEQQEGALSLVGKISSPQLHRPNKTGHYLFLNGRSVNSPFFAKKIVECYGTRLPSHRFPLFILNLQLPPDWIDVNVHPQKKEVRICEEDQLASFVERAMTKSLEFKTVHALSSNPFSDHSSYSHKAFLETSLSVCEAASEENSSLPLQKKEAQIFVQSVGSSPNSMQNGVEESKTWNEFHPSFQVVEEASSSKEISPNPKEASLLSLPWMVIGKVNHIFLLQEAEGIRLIDGMGALERIVFEQLTQKETPPETQVLLFPIQIKIVENPSHSQRIQKLNERGFTIRHFGRDTFLIEAIPAILEIQEVEEVIFIFLEEGRFTIGISKCVRKRNLPFEYAVSLIEKLYKCKNPDFTPDGKKIDCFLNGPALEKFFRNKAS